MRISPGRVVGVVLRVVVEVVVLLVHGLQAVRRHPVRLLEVVQLFLLARSGRVPGRPILADWLAAAHPKPTP